MKRRFNLSAVPLLLCGLSLLLTCPGYAQAPNRNSLPVTTLATGELQLEGQIQNIESTTGQVTISATAFATAAGRKEIAPAKPKTLITTTTSRFFDERTQHDFALADLTTGLVVRVIGRDTGTGKPLNARLLLWRSPEPNEPPDPDTPEPLKGLLPPSRATYGVRVRVFNAGFESEKKLFTWGTNSRPVYFLAFRTFTPADDNTHRPWWDWVNFVSLSTPDGQTSTGSGSDSLGDNVAGRAITFPRVDPRWKSVTATWEITAANAPADASGIFKGFYQIKGESPTPQKPRVEPKTVIQTARGTLYTLESIECDFEKKTTNILIGIQKSDDVPDVEITTVQSGINDDKGTGLRSTSYSSAAQLQIHCDALPSAGAKSITVGLDVRESAPSWKKKEFFHLISIDVPVAALVKANPPTLNTEGAMPFYKGENEAFQARLDERNRSESYWMGTLWVRPKTVAEAINTLVENVSDVSGGKAITTDGRSFDIIATPPSEEFFHGDGSAPTTDERAFNLQIDIKGDVPATPVRLQLDTTQTRQVTHIVDVPAVAIPAAGAPINFDGPKQGGSLKLKEVALVKGQGADDIALRTGGRVRIPSAGALVLVFSVERAFPDSNMTVKNLRFGEDAEAPSVKPRSIWNGDALSDAKEGKPFTVVLEPPAQGTTNLKLHAEFAESTPSTTTPPLVVEGVMLNPAPAKTAGN